jgi:hypothetical protein
MAWQVVSVLSAWGDTARGNSDTDWGIVAMGRLLGTKAQNAIRPYRRLSRDRISQIAVVSLVTCSTVRIFKSDFFNECYGEHLVSCSKTFSVKNCPW